MAQRISPDTRGVFIIAATPFTDSGEVDYDSIDTLTFRDRHHGLKKIFFTINDDMGASRTSCTIGLLFCRYSTNDSGP